MDKTVPRPVDIVVTQNHVTISTAPVRMDVRPVSREQNV